jgi:hypothetical protein
MIKAIYAITVSAIAAGCFVAFPILSQQVHANPPAPAVAVEHIAAAPRAGNCGQDAWPYIDAACLRNASEPAVAPREVRFVSADSAVRPASR